MGAPGTTVTYYIGYNQTQVSQYPLKAIITDISNQQGMILTFGVNPNYEEGQNITFLIPSEYGMQELNSINANIVTIIDSLNIQTDVDSTNFSIFSYPSPLPNAYSLPYTIPNAEGDVPPPPPLPFGNQRPFFGTVYNNGIN